MYNALNSVIKASIDTRFCNLDSGSTQSFTINIDFITFFIYIYSLKILNYLKRTYDSINRIVESRDITGFLLLFLAEKFDTLCSTFDNFECMLLLRASLYPNKS